MATRPWGWGFRVRVMGLVPQGCGYEVSVLELGLRYWGYGLWGYGDRDRFVESPLWI